MNITMLGTGNAMVTECYNTCFVLEDGDKHLLVDGGGGNTLLRQLKQAGFDWKDMREIFVTHKHVDHLMGFPVFPPLFDPTVTCDVYLKTREGRSARAQLETLMAPPLWPVTTSSMGAALTFHDVPPLFQVGPVAVETMESRHPGGSTIYKLSLDGVSVVYATDFEPESGAPGDILDFCDFARGCSLLLLDAQYTQEEYAHTRGFGHSTIPRSLALARACGAGQTIFIHHDPKRTDAQLLNLEASVRAQSDSITFGREGKEVFL